MAERILKGLKDSQGNEVDVKLRSSNGRISVSTIGATAVVNHGEIKLGLEIIAKKSDLILPKKESEV